MSSFINEIIPYVESHYRAVPKKAARAACGIGTGGTTVINAAVMYPTLFDFVLPLSCGVEDNGHLVDDFLRVKKAGVKLFWTGCGTMDTVAYGPSRTLHDTLSYIHLDHTFFMMTGGRDWTVWRHFLTNFAPMIFINQLINQNSLINDRLSKLQDLCQTIEPFQFSAAGSCIPPPLR